MVRAMSELERAVETVIGSCLGVRPGEDVVIVVDRTTVARRGAARRCGRAGAEPVMCVMEPRDVDGQEPPGHRRGGARGRRRFIAPTRRSLSHTARAQGGQRDGARGATLPGVTEDMLARLMTGDFTPMSAPGRRRRAADRGRRAHVTCPRGTDLAFDLTGRNGISDDGDLTAPGAFGNLPCGEGFISPLAGEGTLLAVDASPRLGLADAPVGSRRGRPARRRGGGLRASSFMGPGRRRGARHNLAELGVGTNERATLTGNILEDEKMLGTVHIAFGASAGIGGTVSVPVHLDFPRPGGDARRRRHPRARRGALRPGRVTLVAVPNVSEGRDEGVAGRHRRGLHAPRPACCTAPPTRTTIAPCLFLAGEPGEEEEARWSSGSAELCSTRA